VTGSTDGGLALALLATTAYNSGLIAEKQALGQLPAISGRRIVSLALTLGSSPRWLTGFALMLCGLAFQVLALTLAPVTVVQPAIASGVAVVLVLSRLVLREHLGRREYACVAVMALAVIMLALSAGSAAGEVGHRFGDLQAAGVAIPSVLLALAAGGSALHAGSRKHGPPVTGVSYGIATGLLYGVAALAIKALSGALLHRHGVANILIIALSSPYLYVMGASSAAGLLLFQTALQQCRIAIMAPVSNVLGSIYFMVVGTWLFHERLPSDPAHLALRLGGIVIAACVVVLLSRQGATELADVAVSSPRTRRGKPAVSAAAGGVLSAASWLLPPSDRARYAREYDSELWELASAGAGRAGQLLYALRQALCAVQIRRVLLSPRSRSVGP
jgi:drug/metabolite transporter (DMT)-like permease